MLLQNIGGFLPLRQLQGQLQGGEAKRAVRVALLGRLGGCEGLTMGTWPERRSYKLCLAKQALMGDYAAGYAGFRNTTVRAPQSGGGGSLPRAPSHSPSPPFAGGERGARGGGAHGRPRHRLAPS